MLAISGNLVGGGMHSCHESMNIARRVGVPYNPGAYIRSLPVSFIYSPQFAQWRDEYYDVVVLGEPASKQIRQVGQLVCQNGPLTRIQS